MSQDQSKLTRRSFLGASAAGVSLLTVPASARAETKPGEPTKAASGGPSPFGKDFLWGAATAAYQVEGAAAEDGKGPSVWDVFVKKPGAIYEGHTGDVACDHYHRYKEDVALMKQLGIKAYRFSISWPRVIPQGTGAVNEKGFDFYKRLLDELEAAKIIPLCTLFHWDLPQALQQRGGWGNRDIARWFGDYAAAVADRFQDRVKWWMTQNEPQCFIGLALRDGVHAPGEKLKDPEYLTAAHNAMRAQGQAVLALRAHAKGGKVGCVWATQPKRPSTNTPGDIEAAREATYAVKDRSEWNNSWWMDPVLLGHYPEDGLKVFGKDMPSFPAQDLEEIKQPLDFVGVNVYNADAVRRGADGRPEPVPAPPGYPRAGSDWQAITPSALYWGTKFFHEKYKLPIMITENGLSTRDQIFLDGKVHDPQRIDYMNRALVELGQAMKEGIPVLGFCAWSFLDNFEWGDGYKQRFGLVYVDYQNQKRVPKDSFYWYAKVIRSGGKALYGKTAVPYDVVTP